MAVKRLIRHRKRALYRAMGIGLGHDKEDSNSVNYYTILDLEEIGERIHGRKFADWLLSHMDVTELLFQLAKDAHVVLLPGRGFGVRHPSGRVSLANLNEADYKSIGQAIRALIEKYVERFNTETSEEPLPNSKVALPRGVSRSCELP
ncbi:unnamed protein product [Rotaria sp. Silwood2]|nr:unnamed protein product [Rotaria sp. Silwood2]CAF2877184.1 unnamed protein product [Rotaria sp. Silwood2]CAF4167978.1 unnamed protein product [Rotaria sp. Silwood2]CAF4487773.1 unnamed protein product [Rotaria sp. Silwood2]